MKSIKSCIGWFFRRSKKSVIESLEDIEEEIMDLENLRLSSIDRSRRYVFRLVVYSFVIFGLSFIVSYYYYWPSTSKGKVILLALSILYPLLIYILKLIFRAAFLRRVNKTDCRLKELRAEKRKLLEEVMEKETFNKAQQILVRFDPLSFTGIMAEEKDKTKSPLRNRIPSTPHTELRRRIPKDFTTCDGDTITEAAFATSKELPEKQPLNHQNQSTSNTQPCLLRPLLPRERTFIDRIVDVLVGDGPDKRYALICEHCFSHNGMALQEEFEYLAFNCCYCHHFNPARRVRPKPSVPSSIMQSNPVVTSDMGNHTSDLDNLPNPQSMETGGQTENFADDTAKYQ